MIAPPIKQCCIRVIGCPIKGVGIASYNTGRRLQLTMEERGAVVKLLKGHKDLQKKPKMSEVKRVMAQDNDETRQKIQDSVYRLVKSPSGAENQ